jgi:Xaa-Pro aminopeptidase
MTAFGHRMDRVRARMGELGVDALLLSLGADLPWLTGYTAMPLERLTMLVLPADGDAVLLVPRLEAPRVVERPGVFELRPWSEGDDPVGVVGELIGSRRRLAISDRAWSTFLLQLQALLPAAEWHVGSAVTGPIRAVKDDVEIEALRVASAAADRVAAQLLAGEIALIGRTEDEVSKDIGARLIAEGHARVNFAIVGSGPNAASPHHEPGTRVIGPAESVVCDFGGTYHADVEDGAGYCSDITRTVFTGEPSAEFRELYEVLQDAQAAAVKAAVIGARCEDVDREARQRIDAAGYGEYFIHRTGHGIGLEEHEDPYIVGGNHTALTPGHAFSVEPGIYIPGRFGARIEDIVIAGVSGPDSLNHVDRGLHVVEV